MNTLNRTRNLGNDPLLIRQWNFYTRQHRRERLTNWATLTMALFNLAVAGVVTWQAWPLITSIRDSLAGLWSGK